MVLYQDVLKSGNLFEFIFFEKLTVYAVYLTKKIEFRAKIGIVSQQRNYYGSFLCPDQI